MRDRADRRRHADLPPAVARRACPGRVVAVSSSDSPIKGVKVLLEADRQAAHRSRGRARRRRPAEAGWCGGERGRGARPRGHGALRLGADRRGHRGAARLSAEIAVVPSLYEGFSIPAVEAMACATPLIASRAGALPEVVGDRRHAPAFWCSRAIPAELADALRRALRRRGPARLDRGRRSRPRRAVLHLAARWRRRWSRSIATPSPRTRPRALRAPPITPPSARVWPLPRTGRRGHEC